MGRGPKGARGHHEIAVADDADRELAAVPRGEGAADDGARPVADAAAAGMAEIFAAAGELPDAMAPAPGVAQGQQPGPVLDRLPKLADEAGGGYRHIVPGLLDVLLLPGNERLLAFAERGRPFGAFRGERRIVGKAGLEPGNELFQPFHRVGQKLLRRRRQRAADARPGGDDIFVLRQIDDLDLAYALALDVAVPGGVAADLGGDVLDIDPKHDVGLTEEVLLAGEVLDVGRREANVVADVLVGGAEEFDELLERSAGVRVEPDPAADHQRERRAEQEIDRARDGVPVRRRRRRRLVART